MFIINIFFSSFFIIDGVKAYYLLFKQTISIKGKVTKVIKDSDKAGAYTSYTIYYLYKNKVFYHSFTLRKSEDNYKLNLNDDCFIQVSKFKPKYSFFEKNEFYPIFYFTTLMILFDFLFINKIYFSYRFKR
jgi:hypothetical protein